MKLSGKGISVCETKQTTFERSLLLTVADDAARLSGSGPRRDVLRPSSPRHIEEARRGCDPGQRGSVVEHLKAVDAVGCVRKAWQLVVELLPRLLLEQCHDLCVRGLRAGQ